MEKQSSCCDVHLVPCCSARVKCEGWSQTDRMFLYLESLLWGQTDFYLQVFNLSQFLLQLPHLTHLEKSGFVKGSRVQGQTARNVYQSD